ncbi:MAG: RIO1 family regulatory kinase/ATPase, partial [Chloroflexota bacterium]
MNQTPDDPERVAAEPAREVMLDDEHVRYADYDAEYEDVPHFEISPKVQRRKAMTGQRRAVVRAAFGDTRPTNEVQFTFKAKRFEEEWLIAYLKVFYDDQMITDVLRQVKGGKEATVYCCRAHPRTGYDLLAVKVYRPRRFRNLRNDAQYRAGRDVLDEQGKAVRALRELRAMEKKTRFGKELQHGAWLAHEYQTLQRLHAAGVDVPRPIAQSDNAILMEYIGDEDEAAPSLQEVSLDRAEARALFERLMRNVGLMLSQDRIHADLSAY